jgi:hypothetical protein
MAESAIVQDHRAERLATFAQATILAKAKWF